MKTLITTILIIGVGLSFFLFSIVGGIRSEHGGYNIRLAVERYVSVNGKMPNSWNDIEEYHADPVLGIKTTRMVSKYWNVAWGIDLKKNQEKSKSNLNESPPSIVFRRDANIDPDVVSFWDVGEKIANMKFD